MQSSITQPPTTTAIGATTTAPDAFTASVVATLPSILWVILAIWAVCHFQNHLNRLASALVKRLESGAAFKFGAIELSPFRVMSDPRSGLGSAVRSSIDNSRALARKQKYEENHYLFIAHRLFPSEQPNQTYDIWIYLVSHKTDMNAVDRVEYFFGESWNNQVFTSSDRGKRFGVLASAYGSGFLCLARVFFKDGRQFDTWRYIDFEQGERSKD
jgi:hypothetical protein